MGIDIMKLIVWIQVLIKETICCELGNSHNPTWILNPPHKRVDRWLWIWPSLAWFYVFCIFQLGLNNLYWVEHVELNIVNISFNVYHHRIHVSTLQRATIQDGIVHANWFPKKKKKNLDCSTSPGREESFENNTKWCLMMSTCRKQPSVQDINSKLQCKMNLWAIHKQM